MIETNVFVLISYNYEQDPHYLSSLLCNIQAQMDI